MLKEAIEFVFGVGQSSKKTEIINHPHDPDQFFLTGPDGCKEIKAPRRNKDMQMTVSDAVDFAAIFGRGGGEGRSDVVVTPEAAMGYLDRRLCENKLVFACPLTEALKLCGEWSKGKNYDQKSLVRVLRTVFSGMADREVVDYFRFIDWTVTKNVRSAVATAANTLTVSTGGSAVGKDGAAKERESFKVMVPLFDSGGPSFGFTVLIELDTDRQQILIDIPHEQFRNALEQRVGSLIEVIQENLEAGYEEHFRVVHGQY